MSENKKTTTQVSKKTLPTGIEATDFFKWAHELGKCQFYRKLGAGGVIAILLTARELGLPMMASLNGGLYNIDGKVSISAQMMNSMILNAGHRVDIKVLDDERCILTFKRKDREEGVDYEYTYQEAMIAGYDKKNNWKSHRKDMLYCRCLAGGARKIMPDAIGNCYVHGELSETQEFDGAPIEPQEPQQQEIQEEPQAQISFDKPEGYEDFIKNHGIFEGSEKDNFIDYVLKNTTKSKDEVVLQAFENQESFLKTFEEWKKDQS